MKIDSDIFKAYDIRGIYPKQLNSKIAYDIGRGYGSLIIKETKKNHPQIVVGRDMRLSGPVLKKALIKGLTDTGINVIDIGLTSTPTFYFVVAFYHYDGGIQVSASHNPKQYNGMKLVRQQAVPVSGTSGINKICQMVVRQKFLPVNKTGQVFKKTGYLKDLVKNQTQTIDLKTIKPLTIVVDAANAMGSIDINAMFKSLPCKLIKLNFKLDGSFPAHEADPFKDENLNPTIEAVLKHHADLGISIDGDGDRYFFVDETGQLIRQEILRGIMAQMALKKHPRGTVCYDIRPGRITKDLIEAVGGKACVTPVGHSLIKEKMIASKAVFGGESSGHFFYRFDYGVFESPVMYVLSLLEFICRQQKPVSEIFKPFKKYFHSGEINSVVKNPQTIMKKIATKYYKGKISHLDGITVTFKDFWFNVRSSNTEPKIRLNLEATTQKIMEQKRDEVLNLIRS